MSEIQYALQLENVCKSFASVKVLKNITLKLKKGTILGLVGENGAGKSTLMNILGGIHKRDSGDIFLNEKHFDISRPKESQRAGIAFIQQELNLFLNLSVSENLFIMKMPRFLGFHLSYRKMNMMAKNKLVSIGIDNISPSSIVGTLPMGQRQLVEITKAVTNEADIIILDEPTTSLSNKEKEKLFTVMHDLKNKGKSLIFISHILEDVFNNCDDIAVIRDGEMIGQAVSSSFTENEVIHMMVGRKLSNIYPSVEKEIGNVIFEAKNITKENRFDKVSISLRKGEIVGMFGLLGAGRTEYLRSIFGIDSIDNGNIFFEDKPILNLNPENCIKNGMAFITENRREEGLLLSKTVKENTVMTKFKTLGKNIFGFIDTQLENSISERSVSDLGIKTFDASKQAVINLSGGNQQKVVFGKWVILSPKVFLLDEPTRGVDVGARYEIYSIINDLAKNGSTILMVSSEMEELIGLCDRILVMSHNKITGEFAKNFYSQEEIITAAIME